MRRSSGCGSEQPNESPYMKELIVRCKYKLFTLNARRHEPSA